MLEQPDKKNALLAEESGFANETTFYRAFKTAFGLSPREWITTEMQNTGKANEQSHEGNEIIP
jgi:AraC-like DNA-binding protein